MTDEPKKPTPAEAQAAIRKLEQRVRNASSDPSTQAGHAWPDAYAEIARQLAEDIPADAPDDVFKGAVNALADRTTKLFRPWVHGAKDVRDMTNLEKHEEANRRALAAAEAAKAAALKKAGE